MAYSNDPICFAGIANFAAKATAAKTTMEDATNAALLYTAPTNGAEITRAKARALGTLSGATVLYLFTSSDAGVTLRLKEAVLISSDTVSTTDPPTATDLNASEDVPIVLSGGERLYCGISVALAAGVLFEGHARTY